MLPPVTECQHPGLIWLEIVELDTLGLNNSEDIRRRRKQYSDKENLPRKTRPAWEVMSFSVQAGAGGNISDQEAAILKRKRIGDMVESRLRDVVLELGKVDF